MSVVFTTVFRVKDWPALYRLSDLTLIAFARAAGARRYRLYRNSYDAAEALLLVEGAKLDELQLLRALLMRRGAAVVSEIEPADESAGKIWEPAECRTIG